MTNYLAFDVGGSFIKCGVVNEEGTVLFHDKMATNSHYGAEELLKQLYSIVESVRTRYDVKNISIATTGVVNTVKGSILSGISGWIEGYSDLPLKSLLEKQTGLVTEVENDVNCVALAESWLGSARGYRNIVCITIGTGIGGALLIDGKLYHGSGNMAMEIGRMPLYPSTLEDLASVRALVYEYAKRKNLPTTQVDGLCVARKVREGDEAAIKSLDMMCRYLADGLGAIISALTPDVFIIGGAISADHDLIDHRIKGVLRERLDKALYESTSIKYAQLGNMAGLVGGVRHHQIMSEWRKNKQEEAI